MGDGLNFILGAICLCSGTGIGVKGLIKILKRQGILLVVKFSLSILLALGVSMLLSKTHPELASYVISATALLLIGVVATSLLTSFLVERLHSKNTERQANK